MDIHRIHLDKDEAGIAQRGAELQALRLNGLDLLWTAGPLWPRHAPLLFPVVGALKEDILRHEGLAFPMPRHGFARDRDFTWIRRTERGCTLELRDDEETRAAYPFAFRLQVSYDLEASGLRMAVQLQNPGIMPLPASLGLHPAFRWPLVPGLPKASHRLVFAAAEPGPLRRLETSGLLAPEAQTTPIHDHRLDLRESLFAQDALIFLEPLSRSVTYLADDGPAVTLCWEGFPHLGLWTKPETSPSFLCIEPWAGYASPVDWDGEFVDKPGGFLLAPGAERRWGLTMASNG